METQNSVHVKKGTCGVQMRAANISAAKLKTAQSKIQILSCVSLINLVKYYSVYSCVDQ